MRVLLVDDPGCEVPHTSREEDGHLGGVEESGFRGVVLPDTFIDTAFRGIQRAESSVPAGSLAIGSQVEELDLADALAA